MLTGGEPDPSFIAVTMQVQFVEKFASISISARVASTDRARVQPKDNRPRLQPRTTKRRFVTRQKPQPSALPQRPVKRPPRRVHRTGKGCPSAKEARSTLESVDERAAGECTSSKRLE